MPRGMKPREEDVALDALRQLVEDVSNALEATKTSSQSFGGIAFHDTSKDELITKRPSFEPACEAVRALPTLSARYGSDNASRLVLQFVYELPSWQSGSPVDVAVDEVWQDFLAELADPKWTYRAVANLRHFALNDSMEQSIPQTVAAASIMACTPFGC